MWFSLLKENRIRITKRKAEVELLFIQKKKETENRSIFLLLADEKRNKSQFLLELYNIYCFYCLPLFEKRAFVFLVCLLF